MLRKLCWYIQDWWMWAKASRNCIPYRIAVLLRLERSPSFEFIEGWHQHNYEWSEFIKKSKEERLKKLKEEQKEIEYEAEILNARKGEE